MFAPGENRHKAAIYTCYLVMEERQSPQTEEVLVDEWVIHTTLNQSPIRKLSWDLDDLLFMF